MTKRRVVIDPKGKEVIADENVKEYVEIKPIPIESEIEKEVVSEEEEGGI
jgi:hypothetical protein